jgi:hypothetical protein
MGVEDRTSQRNSFLEDVLPDSCLEAVLCRYVHWPLQELLKLQLESGMIEQAPAPLQIDQEIDVALRVGFSPSDRAKDTYVRGSMAGCDPKDLLSPMSQDLFNAYASSRTYSTAPSTSEKLQPLGFSVHPSPQLPSNTRDG